MHERVCVWQRERMSDSVPTAQALHMGGRDLATDEASAWNHPSATLQVFPMIILLALSADLWVFFFFTSFLASQASESGRSRNIKYIHAWQCHLPPRSAIYNIQRRKQLWSVWVWEAAVGLCGYIQMHSVCLCVCVFLIKCIKNTLVASARLI